MTPAGDANHVVIASVTTRWASLVVRNIECPVDPRTLAIWGHFVGASVPTLRSRCAAIGVGTKASLDFTRLLRALVRAHQTRSDPLQEFDVCDMRTVRRLFERGSLGDPYSRSPLPTLEQFLAAQRVFCIDSCLNGAWTRSHNGDCDAPSVAHRRFEMLRSLRHVVVNWRSELFAMALGVGLLVSAPTLLQAQTCDSDENHYHSGADHCDSGGSGCTVVCKP
jgi:hypothetical protein